MFYALIFVAYMKIVEARIFVTTHPKAVLAVAGVVAAVVIAIACC